MEVLVSHLLFTILSFFFLFLCFSCAEKKVPETPEALYREAMKKAEGGIFSADYKTAEEYLQKIIELFPSSKYVPDANFGIAYVKMKSGDCAEASLLFENFYRNYRSHEKAPDALYYAIKCYMKFVDTPDRDITYAEKVRELAKEFLKNFDWYPKAEEVKEIREKVLNIIAEHHVKVAEFYARRKIFRPALRRLETILKDKELSNTEAGKDAQKIYREILKATLGDFQEQKEHSKTSYVPE